MAPGISEGAGALSQYERDRQFAMQQREQQLREQQAAFSQQLQSAQFQQSQVQPFQLNEQRAGLEAQGRVQDLTIHEQMRMQRLQQQISAVQEDMRPGGRLDPVQFPGVGANMMTQLRSGLDPLEAQMRDSQRRHTDEQTQQIADARARMASMDEQDRLYRARSLQERIVMRPNPMADVWARMFPDAEPLPDLEHVEQPNGTFLPLNDGASQAAIAAGMQLHAAQIQQRGQDRAITPEAAARINHEIEAALDRREEGLQRAVRDAIGPQVAVAQRHLDEFIAARPAERVRRLNDARAFVHQNAGVRPSGNASPAANPVPGTHPAYSQEMEDQLNQLVDRARELAPPREQEVSRGGGAVVRSRVASTLMLDAARARVLLRQYGRTANMPAAEQAEFLGIQGRLQQAGVVPRAVAPAGDAGFSGGTF